MQHTQLNTHYITLCFKPPSNKQFQNKQVQPTNEQTKTANKQPTNKQTNQPTQPTSTTSKPYQPLATCQGSFQRILQSSSCPLHRHDAIVAPETKPAFLGTKTTNTMVPPPVFPKALSICFLFPNLQFLYQNQNHSLLESCVLLVSIYLLAYLYLYLSLSYDPGSLSVSMALNDVENLRSQP